MQPPKIGCSSYFIQIPFPHTAGLYLTSKRFPNLHLPWGQLNLLPLPQYLPNTAIKLQFFLHVFSSLECSFLDNKEPCPMVSTTLSIKMPGSSAQINLFLGNSF